MKKVLYLSCLFLLSNCIFANEKRIIYDYEYGIFAHGFEDFEEGDRAAATQGELEKSTYVKARLGTKFGVRYWLSRAGYIGEPNLHLIYHVPTMIHPDTGEYINKIEEIVKEGIKKGQIKQGNSQAIASEIYGLICSSLVYKLRNNGQIEIMKLYKEFENTIIQGLKIDEKGNK